LDENLRKLSKLSTDEAQNQNLTTVCDKELKGEVTKNQLHRQMA